MENTIEKVDLDFKSKRVGDVFTTLWLETAGLITFMSLAFLLPTIFRVLG
ncbi:MAG: hypothetical protein AAF304_00645 [Pseudomonadota bacterium]